MTQEEGSGETVWVGGDVSKDNVDIAVLDGPSWCAPMTVEALEEVVTKLPSRHVHLVVESTGGYEELVVAVFRRAGACVSVVNPKRVRDFARACGQFAKADPVDARVLAHFGGAMRPRPQEPMDPETRELRALLDRRHQLVTNRVAEKNRLQLAPPTVRGDIREHIAWLTERIGYFDELLADMVELPRFESRARLMRSVPGVGPITTVTLLALLPELGSLDRKRIASLVGLAPFANESGAIKGRRRIFGGRARVRSILYIAAVVATRHNPPLEAFYERLVASGKAKKAAFTAVARKLLIQLNAILRDGVEWSLPASQQNSCC